MRRRRVESCASICTPRDVSPRTGNLLWESDGLGVRYELMAGPRLVLRFRGVVQDIPLTSTPQHLGGVRWWFRCPGCAARVGRLHMPPRASAFYCRGCHGLSYESAQFSRSFSAKLFQDAAAKMRGSTRTARDLIRLRHTGRTYEPKRFDKPRKKRRIDVLMRDSGSDGW